MSRLVINDVKALEIIDNRGMPTLRVRVFLADGSIGWADVPCGSSTGAFEAVEIRDGDARYNGKGVRRALANVRRIIAPAVRGFDAADQRGLDRLLVETDGSPDKSLLGANAILGVSLAAARAAAAGLGLPLYRHLNPESHILPVPQASLLNGGIHSGNDLDIQEFCVMPVGRPTFAEALRCLAEVFQSLKGLLLKDLGPQATNASEDGGFAPPLSSSDAAMDYLIQAVDLAGYSDDVVYGLDVAAGGFFDPDRETYTFEGAELDRPGMIGRLGELLAAYPAIVAIEDPLHEDDLKGWAAFTAAQPERMVIGDDLFATNIERLKLGLEHKAATATLCKVNQIGTLTEAMDAARFAGTNGLGTVMSVRSGETEDAILSDVSVALGAGLFKTGGMRGSDRGTNYNRFLEIEDELGEAAVYAGRDYARLTT